MSIKIIKVSNGYYVEFSTDVKSWCEVYTDLTNMAKEVKKAIEAYYVV